MKDDIVERIAEHNSKAIVFHGLNDAIIGMGQQWGSSAVVVYDRDLCIQVIASNFQKESDVSEEDAYGQAVEWFEFNVECAYMGKHTPIIVEKLDGD